MWRGWHCSPLWQRMVQEITCCNDGDEKAQLPSCHSISICNWSSSLLVELSTYNYMSANDQVETTGPLIREQSRLVYMNKRTRQKTGIQKDKNNIGTDIYTYYIHVCLCTYKQMENNKFSYVRVSKSFFQKCSEKSQDAAYKKCCTLTRIRPMQWFTATMGFFHNWATVRATRAVETSGAPIPGPVHKTKNTTKLYISKSSQE